MEVEVVECYIVEEKGDSQKARKWPLQFQLWPSHTDTQKWRLFATQFGLSNRKVANAAKLPASVCEVAPLFNLVDTTKLWLRRLWLVMLVWLCEWSFNWAQMCK